MPKPASLGSGRRGSTARSPALQQQHGLPWARRGKSTEAEEAASSQSISTAVRTEGSSAPTATLLLIHFFSSHPEGAGRNVTLFAKLPERRNGGGGGGELENERRKTRREKAKAGQNIPVLPASSLREPLLPTLSNVSTCQHHRQGDNRALCLPF